MGKCSVLDILSEYIHKQKYTQKKWVPPQTLGKDSRIKPNTQILQDSELIEAAGLPATQTHRSQGNTRT